MSLQDLILSIGKKYAEAQEELKVLIGKVMAGDVRLPQDKIKK